MTAITTKYLCPTNFRGARVKASANGFSVTLDWDYELPASGYGNHVAAAKALCRKLDWHGSLVGGGTEAEHVFCFIRCGQMVGDIHEV